MPTQATVATVHLLINNADVGDAEDIISNLLTDIGMSRDNLIDWVYAPTVEPDVYFRPKLVEIPDDFEEGDGTLEDIASQAQRSLPINSRPDPVKLMRDALAALMDWTRENTGPHDANSPHDLLLDGAMALNSFDRKD